MKERHWTNLTSSLRHGQCILVLGPEIPAQAALPADADRTKTLTLADDLRAALAAELEEDGRTVTASGLAGVAQQYEDAEGFGPGTLRSQAARFYTSSPAAPSEIHHALAQLPFAVVLSTCHDGLLVDALKQAGKSPVSYRYHLRGDRADNPEFLESASVAAPLVYRLFGAYEDPQTLVISENDLLDFLIAVTSDRPPMPNSFRRILQRPGLSLLFVGFGIRHWYLRVLLKVLLRTLSDGRLGGAVAIEPTLHGAPDFDREQTILFYQRGTRIEVSDDDIGPFVAELQRRLAAEGGVASQSLPPGPRPRVFVSYASEDAALAARLFASLRQSGFEPWLDKDALRGGEDWNLTIEDQLRGTDYVLVMETPALVSKRVGYVNKEITIARERAQSFRGAFLIPLLGDGVADADRIAELGSYQSLSLRVGAYDDDLATLVSTMRRDYQRRQR